MAQLERALAKLRKGRSAVKLDLPKEEPPIHTKPGSEVTGELPQLEAKSVVLDRRKLKKMRIVIDGNDTNSAPYKMLRTRALQRMRANGWKTLAVTSPRAYAGKTLTAINTAITLAHDPNQQVCLVDLDLRNPRVAAYLATPQEAGLSDYLLGNASLAEVMFRPDIPRLVVVPNYEAFTNSSEMLASPRMSELVRAVASHSTIVIFDLPPLLEADDMISFSPQVDAMLIVVAQGQTQRVDLEKTGDLIKDLNILGTVLNKSDEADFNYY